MKEKSTVKDKINYGVLILKHDQNDILILETADYQAAYSAWSKFES